MILFLNKKRKLRSVRHNGKLFHAVMLNKSAAKNKHLFYWYETGKRFFLTRITGCTSVTERILVSEAGPIIQFFEDEASGKFAQGTLWGPGQE